MSRIYGICQVCVCACVSCSIGICGMVLPGKWAQVYQKNAMLAGKLIFSNPSLGWNSSTQTTHFWPITSGILCVSLVEWFHGIRCWPGTRALLNLPFEFAHVPIFVGLYRYYMILYIYTYHACRLNPTLRFLRSQLLWLLVGWSPISIHLCCFMWGSKERTWRKREPRWH